MNVLSRVLSWFGVSTAIDQREGIQRTSPMSASLANAPSASVDTALQISAIWACVQLKSRTIGSLPLMLYKDLGNGRRDIDRKHPLWSILHDRPNPRMSSITAFVTLILNYEFRGNAYAAIMRNGGGQVIGLWPLSSDQVETEALPNGTVQHIFRTSQGEQIIADADMVHIKGMGNGLVGMSRLEYMRSTVSLAIKGADYEQSLYANGGKRAGVLSTPNALTLEQKKRTREEFAQLSNGNTAPLYVLEADLKYQALGLTPEDLEFLANKKYTVEEICRWFGVPGILINEKEGTTMWGSGVEQVIDGFYKLTLRPDLEAIEQELQWKLLTPRERQDYTIEFNFDALHRTNLKARYEAYQLAVLNGLKTRNECRQLENDPPLDGGDYLTVQSQNIPLADIRKNLGISHAVQNTSA